MKVVLTVLLYNCKTKEKVCFILSPCFLLSITVSTQGEQTEKSPSDEGFTELEPTLNGSSEEVGGTSSKTSNTGIRDQRELLGVSCPSQGDPQDKSGLCQTQGKVDDDEDEGVAQNSSIEDGESSLETEKQADSHDKRMSQEAADTKDIKSKHTEELLRVDDTVLSAVDQNRKYSLKQASEVHGNIGPMRQSPDRPEEEDDVSEEERRKKNYEAEVKSWLLERMQAPIEGRSPKLDLKSMTR